LDAKITQYDIICNEKNCGILLYPVLLRQYNRFAIGNYDHVLVLRHIYPAVWWSCPKAVAANQKQMTITSC
jgi:hypothetical protein